MPSTPPPIMLAPPEGIFQSFEDLMSSVQRVAKEQGYGIVKLRASNYRDHKPTRYDLVCDRGGVKYTSTAKKRNPTTRKIDCPFRAKAVCEVQLGNQWRFAVQDSRHNHEARVSSSTPSQEAATPIGSSIRSLTHKVERLSHDLTSSMEYIKRTLENLEKRLEAIDARTVNYDTRFQHMEQRLQGIEGPRMDGMGMDDVETRLLASSIV
ncbi:FAR1 DNA-binding domain-containing protein [Sarocladium implicatum]|nr:FAR1 DNA-binding domain-containing protein [Sarocladium implicatum]